MIRIQVFSDLHDGFDPMKPIRIREDVDLVVVPGDIAEGTRNAFRILRDIVPARIPILFVAGNHELYGRFLRDEILAARASASRFGIIFGEEDVIFYEGVRFICATAWTDYRIFGERNAAAAMASARTGMNDHRRIGWQREPWQRFRPQEAALLHSRARSLIAATIAKDHPGPTVVVTHTAPSIRSVPDDLKSDILTAAFASSIADDLLGGSDPSATVGEVACSHTGPSVRPRVDLWIHGHIHARSDYMLGNGGGSGGSGCRVVCNPHGYGEEVAYFDPCLVLEVGS